MRSIDDGVAWLQPKTLAVGCSDVGYFITYHTIGRQIVSGGTLKASCNMMDRANPRQSINLLHEYHFCCLGMHLLHLNLKCQKQVVVSGDASSSIPQHWMEDVWRERMVRHTRPDGEL